MSVSPLAGKPAPPSILVDVPKLIANEVIIPDLSVGPRGPVLVQLPAIPRLER